jgi:transketolase
LGLPEEKYFVSQETRDYFASHRAELQEEYKAWEATYDAWRKANPEKARLIDTARERPNALELLGRIPKFSNAAIATRKAGSDVLQPLAEALPLFISGSADLHGSTLNYINSSKDWNKKNGYVGRNIRFGIREHAMGAMLNGLAYYNLFRPSGATFLVFADYLRPAIRIAALSHLPVVYIFTHDS